MPVRLHQLQEKPEVVVFDVAVDQDIAVEVHHADVHIACMQVDSAVVFRRRFVILHLSLLRLVVNWRRLLREVSRMLDQEEALNFSLRN
jgi:hypothetical protein